MFHRIVVAGKTKKIIQNQMSKPSEEKIYREIDKCKTKEEISAIYEKVKAYCTKKFTEQHKEHSDIAEDLISRIDKMNTGK